MIGIVFLKDSKQIISIVPDVQSHSDTDIIGNDASIKGIDLTLASFCIVNSTILQVGDILGAFTDTRSSLHPSTESRLAAAEAALLSLMGL